MNVERQFPHFAWNVTRGLYYAVLSDTDVFLLTLAGALLGGRKGMGKAMLAYVAARRADQYVNVVAHKLDKIAAVNSSQFL